MSLNGARRTLWTKLLTKDEARRNIAKLPELLSCYAKAERE
jgi:hypothetical protein